MEYILSVEEMRRADSIAIDDLGIPGVILMENAGLKAAQCISDRFFPIYNKNIGIFCGKGNNGGDGFVIGRHLSRMGANVFFWLTGEKTDLKGDAEINMKIAEKLNLPIQELSTWNAQTKLTEFDILIDALLGTGLKGDVRGIYKEIISSINASSAFRAAVDTPSGLDCDNGQPLGTCVKADVTITMGNIKTGMLFYPAPLFIGDLYIADLNVPDSVFEQIKPKKFALELHDYQGLLPDRPPDAYKNTFGKVLVLAGSTGLTGAACMTSLSAFRSGAGMVILGCPKSLNPVFETKLTEVMTDPLPDTETGSLKEAAFEAVQKSLNWSHVLALGPGLSTHAETKKFVHRVLKEQNHPMVIDADGLNNLADDKQLLKNYGNDLVITPHVGELSRLTKLSIKEIQADPIAIVRRFASEWGIALLLKGRPTLIGDPDGTIFFNPSGNAGMATAGSGDVLTGLIAGFLAQGLNAVNAAVLGAFVHGLTGNRANWLMGQRGMIAADLQEQIPKTLQELENSQDTNIYEYHSDFGTRLF